MISHSKYHQVWLYRGVKIERCWDMLNKVGGHGETTQLFPLSCLSQVTLTFINGLDFQLLPQCRVKYGQEMSGRESSLVECFRSPCSPSSLWGHGVRIFRFGTPIHSQTATVDGQINQTLSACALCHPPTHQCQCWIPCIFSSCGFDLIRPLKLTSCKSLLTLISGVCGSWYMSRVWLIRPPTVVNPFSQVS